METGLGSNTVKKVLTLLRNEGLLRGFPLHLIGREVIAVLDVRRGTATTDLVEAIHASNPSLDPVISNVIDHSISEAVNGQLIFRCQLEPALARAS